MDADGGTRGDALVHARAVLHFARELAAGGSDVVARDDSNRWRADRILPVMQKDPTLAAAILLRDHTRHRDDATVVVLRREDQ